MPPAPRPASRIRQTHDAAPQEPRGPRAASTIRTPPFATPHPTPRIAQTHDAAPQEPSGPRAASTIRTPPFAIPHPAFRIAQTHDAAPQEPRGPATRIRNPPFATLHPTFRIAQTHDAAPQEPCGPATRIRNPPFATPHPAFRIAQTHDAAPQEPCGPQPPGGGGPQLALASFACTPQDAAASYGRKPQQSATAKPDTSDADSIQPSPRQASRRPLQKNIGAGKSGTDACVFSNRHSASSAPRPARKASRHVSSEPESPTNDVPKDYASSAKRL